MPRNQPNDERKKIARLEGGLTERQKSLARYLITQLAADAIQEEAIVESGIYDYKDLFDLTQEDGFVAWQKKVLMNTEITEENNPAKIVLGTAIQLESADLLLQAIQGYITHVRRHVHTALENVKHAGFAVIEALEGEVTTITFDDKEGIQWQMFTTAMTPDSVMLRRAPLSANPKRSTKRKPKKAKRGARKRSTKSSPLSPKPRERSE